MNLRDALQGLNLVYPDGIGRGFPLWTEDGLKCQNDTLKIFTEIFSEKFNIEINYPRQIQKVDDFFSKYKTRVDKYDSTIACFEKNQSEYMYITDALPFNLEKMSSENKKALLSYYYMIRLLDSKQVPMSRDYYISPLLQLNLSMKNSDKQECIDYVVKCMKEFCKKINLPIVVYEYDGVKGYSEKVFMVSALNDKGETQTILQCSLMSKELLNELNLDDKFKNTNIFDIGYSQKLFAYLAYNNSDEFGMRMPSIYKYKDVAIIYNHKFNSNTVKKLIENKHISNKIYINNELGIRKLKTIKNEYIRKGARIIIVQNIENEKEFFKVYSINKGIYEVSKYEEICEIIKNAKTELDLYYYNLNDLKIERIRKIGEGYVSEFNSKGRVV